MKVGINIHGIFIALVLILIGSGLAVFIINYDVASAKLISKTAKLDIRTETDFKWSNSTKGFNVTGLIPGSGINKRFFLRNGGTAGLRVSVSSSANRVKMTGINDARAVLFKISSDICPATVYTSLAELQTKNGGVELPCGPLPFAAEGSSEKTGLAGNYTLTFDIKPDTPMSSTVKIDRFDLEFKGDEVR